MFKSTSVKRKLSFFLIFIFTFLFSIQLSLPSINANEVLLPEAKDWHINGIIAALDDVYPEVQESAFYELKQYKLKNLNNQQAKKIAKKVANLLKNLFPRWWN